MTSSAFNCREAETQPLDGNLERRVLLVRHLQSAGLDRHGRLGLNIIIYIIAGSGRQGRLPAPGAHTTVRTVPYTAVQEKRASRRSSSRKLTSPILRSILVGTAWFM